MKPLHHRWAPLLAVLLALATAACDSPDETSQDVGTPGTQVPPASGVSYADYPGMYVRNRAASSIQVIGADATGAFTGDSLATSTTIAPGDRFYCRAHKDHPQLRLVAPGDTLILQLHEGDEYIYDPSLEGDG